MDNVELITSLRLIKLMYFNNEINEETYKKIRQKYKDYKRYLPLKSLEKEVINK